mmetsp:Transcript_4159/g.7230  ORF Transcript_4159/g.7230 Transcript_4159/m.7230 type:complete len:179 (+) Transcript_4159:352-888(+)
MSVASVSSSSFREQQLCGFKRQQQQQREQPEQHFEQQHPQQQQQLLESVNRHKERVMNASLRVEVLECQIREEVEKLISLVGSSCSHSVASNPSSHHNIDNVDDNNNNNPNIHQLESHLLQLENDLLTEQRTLAEYEKSYQVSLERTKQRWKQQIEEHQRRFRVCYRAVPHHSRTKSL